MSPIARASVAVSARGLNAPPRPGSLGRAAALRKWARDRGFDLAVSHNSYAQIAAAAALGIKTVTLMDYEHQPANHLAFRLASRVIVPRAFPAAELRRYGAAMRKLIHIVFGVLKFGKVFDPDHELLLNSNS